ncbi:hypothetical protein [Gloeothece verrucosa]|uniref:Uncharacterized protein n=1 Tax=Gloeothece verrucosa (strain PCC 7822) TaxID=497965 RepID=E0U5H2_GLOV7|nr:hypothetical protein [Gloeothece verrucosa]ADN13562.1 conserved hypothetical protein [Gloeothece verrucosa PCC 7822]
MTSPTPLKGSELIDCARANGNQGLEIAASRSGYGDDLAAFEEELRQACQAIGVDINGFDDLINHKRDSERPGVIIAPDTPSQL